MQEHDHVRLTVGEWLGLWWQGRADARRHLPGLRADAIPQTTLPQVEAIRRQAAEVCESERLRLLSDLTLLRGRAQHAAAMLTAAEAELTHAEGLLADAESRPPQTELRRRGEEDLEPWLVAGRRLREHAQRVERLGQQVHDRRLAADKARAERHIVDQLVEQRHQETRVRVHRSVHHGERRLALYWRSLIRRHRKRQPLNEQWELPPVHLPAWINAGERS